MITILSSPKPFKGKDKINQYRAISTWKKLHNAEIILYGDEVGLDLVGKELNVKIVKDIEMSKDGIPLFNSIISHSEKNGLFKNQMYINCDILINETILDALNSISLNRFLLIGERMDLEKNIYVDLFENNYKQSILKKIKEKKILLHGPTGIDFFIFPKGIWKDLPKVVIGRGGYDSSLLAHCRRNKTPIIDGTGVIIALHQFHNYKHIKGGKKAVFYGDDAKTNNIAQGGKYSGNWVSDSDFIIENNKLIPWKCRGEKLRAIEVSLRYDYNFNIGSLIIKMIRKALRFGPLLPPTVDIKIMNKLNN